MKSCALPGCGGPVSPLTGIYTIAGRPDVEYCSRVCLDIAFAEFSKARAREQRNKPEFVTPTKEVGVPHVLASDFGDAGVSRFFCDRSECGKPGYVEWSQKGFPGKFCSNECLTRAKEDTKMSEATEDAAAVGSPIVAGVKKAKKSAKKTAAKPAVKTAKAPAAKASPAKPAVARANGKFADDAVITVKKADHGLRGMRGEALDAMKSDMTVEKYRAALAKKGGRFPTYVAWALKTVTEGGFATVK